MASAGAQGCSLVLPGKGKAAAAQPKKKRKSERSERREKKIEEESDNMASSALNLGGSEHQHDGGGGQKTEEQLSFSCHTLDKATKAKVTLENYYSNLICQHQERRTRWQRLEDSLRDDSISEEQKLEKRAAHAIRETEFLRLKRSRLSVDDFDPLKVRGRVDAGSPPLSSPTRRLETFELRTN